MLAILAIVPGTARRPGDPAGTAPQRPNLPFFMHVAHFDADEYVDRMDRLLSDPAGLAEAIVRDIHGQSRALAVRKYRLL